MEDNRVLLGKNSYSFKQATLRRCGDVADRLKIDPMNAEWLGSTNWDVYEKEPEKMREVLDMILTEPVQEEDLPEITGVVFGMTLYAFFISRQTPNVTFQGGISYLSDIMSGVMSGLLRKVIGLPMASEQSAKEDPK